MIPSPGQADPSRIPRGFPIWPGLLVAAAFGAILVGAEASGRLPASLMNASGRFMIVAHALVALAITTLLGQSATISRWNRALATCRAFPDAGGPPLTAIDDARSRLHRRHASDEFRDEIGKTGKLILDRWQWAWLLGLSVAFIIPLIGFAMGLWNLRIERNTLPWREIGLPLVLGFAEAIPVLLLALGVKNAATTSVADWRHFAEQIGVARRPEGFLPNLITSRDDDLRTSHDDGDGGESNGQDEDWDELMPPKNDPLRKERRKVTQHHQDRIYDPPPPPLPDPPRPPPPPPPPHPPSPPVHDPVEPGSGWEV